jgi:hypothetical protein
VIGAGVAAALAVTVPTYAAYAAGGSTVHPTAKSSKSSPKSTTPPSVAPYTPPPVAGGTTPTATQITPSSTFAVRVDPTGKKPMDTTWPSAATIFTQSELHQVLPRLTAVSATGCHTGTLPSGDSTHQPTVCTLNLTISGEPTDDRSKLMINIRGFGLPQQIGKQWTKGLAQARTRSTQRPGLYTFYANNSLGVSAAYTDGTTTKVLLQHGDVAGEIWFSGIGFTTLSSDYLKSRNLYRTSIVPSLVKLLGAKFTPEKPIA